MTRYIHPDSSFLWKRVNKVIESGGRFQISYKELLEGRAQNGNNSLTFSRLSSLEMTNLAESDAGVYACFVNGTTASADIELIVESTDVVTTPGNYPTLMS